MTNGQTNSRSPRMPAAKNVAQPPPPRASTIHDEAAEEAGRAAQRYYEQIAEITRLTAELDNWHHRAVAAEDQCRRHEERFAELTARLQQRENELQAKLTARENELTAKLEERQQQLIDERDSYRNRLTQLVGQFHAAGNIILSCMQAADSLAGPKVDMTKLLAEVSDINKEPEEQMPRVVTQGPREQPQ